MFHVYLGNMVIGSAFLKGGLVRCTMHQNLNIIRNKILISRIDICRVINETTWNCTATELQKVSIRPTL